MPPTDRPKARCGSRPTPKLWCAIEINLDFAEGHFFLPKALLDADERLDEVIELARTGLRLGPSPAMAPMGHYLLADIFTRLGRTREAEREIASARALEGQG